MLDWINQQRKSDNWLYLFSSNVRFKYMTNCLVVMMLPRGMIGHFRYDLKWLHPILRDTIRQNPTKLKGLHGLVVYMYCELDQQGQNVPIAWYPIRVVRIVDAATIGPAAHIYFEVLGYPSDPAVQVASTEALFLGREYPDMNLLSYGQRIERKQFSETTAADNDAFSQLVDQFNLAHWSLVSVPAQQFDTVFYRVIGLFERGGKPIRPEASLFGEQQRDYRLTSEKPYGLQVYFHHSQVSNIWKRGLTIQLDTDTRRFSNPTPDNIEIASPYDVDQFYVMPIRSNTGWISRMTIGISPKPHDVMAATWNCWVKSTGRVPSALYYPMEILYALLPIFVLLATVVNNLPPSKAFFGPLQVYLSRLPPYSWLLALFLYLVVLALRAVSKRDSTGS